MTEEVEPRIALAIAYRDAFEVSRAGQVVLIDLEKKFCKRPPLDGSLASMNRTAILAAQREVIEYVVRQINRASGIEPDHNPEGDPDE